MANAMSPLRTGSVLLSPLLLALALTGCGHQREAVNIQTRIDQAQARQLYQGLVDPLFAGQKALVGRLDRADVQRALFRLDDGGATLVDTAPEAEDLADDRHAAFFAVKRGDGTRWYYFEPRGIRLIPVEGAAGVEAGDFFPGRGFSLVRTVAVKGGVSAFAGRAGLVRYDFAIDEGAPRCVAAKRLTDHAGSDWQPVVMPAAGRVLFVRQEKPDSQRRLFTVGLDGSDEKPLLAEDWAKDLNLPRLLPDGRVVFAAFREGWWRLYESDAAGAAPRPFAGVPPLPAGSDELVLGMRHADGRSVPTIYALPERLSLEQVLALVEAHHPAINRQRALLVAALVEARRLRLGNLPSLEFGLLSTPANGLLTAGTAASDYLAAGLVRGFLGIAQPLLDWNANVALAEAGQVRAEIARDLLDAEVNERCAEAAEIVHRIAGLQELVTVDAEQTALARRQLQAAAARVDQDAGLRAEELEARVDEAAAVGTLDHQRRELERLRRRLRELCNLPAGTRIAIDGAGWNYDRIATTDLDVDALARSALLNHPHLAAARKRELAAFFTCQGDRSGQPALTARAGYAATGDPQPFDDYVGLSLTGRLPLAGLAAGDLRHRYDQALGRAASLDQEATARVVVAQVDAAAVELQRTRDQVERTRREAAAALERLRVARLHVAIAKPPSTPGDPRDNLVQAEHRYLDALRDTAANRTELAVNHARLYRELGLARRIAVVSDPLDAGRGERARTALGIADPRRVVLTAAATGEFLAAARAQDAKRVYLRGDGDLDLATGFESAARLGLFLNRCHEQGLAVWLQAGDSAWLDDGGAALERTLAAITAFNAGRGAMEPRLAGLRLTIAPRAGQPAFDDAGRRRAEAGLIALLTTARRTAPRGLPLWVVLPAGLFTTGSAEVLARIEQLVDGATLVGGEAAATRIEEQCTTALELWRKPLELDATAAPVADRAALRTRLVERFAGHRRFAGIDLGEVEAADRPRPKPQGLH